MARLNQNQYAKYKGVTRQAVSKAIKEGRLKLGKDGLIDTGEPEGAPAPKAEAMPAYATSKAAAAAYDARLKQLEYQRQKGEVVEVTKVAEEWANICTNVKNSVLAVPDRIALKCDGQPARVIREAMMAELRAALHAVTEQLEKSAA